MRLRSHLALVMAAGLVPGFLCAAIALQQVREGERQAALRGLRETVRATSLIVDREVQSSISALRVLGDSVHLASGDLSAFRAQASALDRPPHVWTLMLDASGTQRVNTITAPDAMPPSPLAAARVSEVLRTQQPLVSDLIVGPATGKLLVTVYVPAAAASGVVVAQAFAADHWRGTALQPDAQSAWIVAIIDRQGRFIARSKRDDLFLGQPARPELVAAAAAAPEGLIRHHTLEKIEVYDAFTHSDVTGWTIAVAAPVDTIEASAWKGVAWLAVGMAMALGLAGAAAAVLSRRLLHDIAGASRAAVRLGQGEPPAPSQTSVGELRVLTSALTNAGRLLDTERRSREAAECERAELLAREVAARERAQQDNAAKDGFLAMLGHELRNPLAGIAGATTLLRRKLVDDGSGTVRHLGVIERQNRHLRSIVDDLLDVSRATSGKIVLDCAPLELAQCVADCIDTVRNAEPERAARLLLAAEPVWVNADRVRIEQVVNNLVGNALKFSDGSSTVQVRVAAEPGSALLEVSDDGSGIDAALLPRVFEPFVQGAGLVGRRASGLGIGLALVRQLVESHRGAVSAHSDGAGRGSRFTVRLPSVQAPAQQAEPAATARGSGATVLLVEDEPELRATTAEALRGVGYRVVEADDGPTALAAVSRTRIDAVVMDIGLPGEDGHALAARMRDEPATAALPLIALTGYGAPASRDAPRAAEVFDDYLVKPAELDTLVRAIEAQLARRRAQSPTDRGPR